MTYNSLLTVGILLSIAMISLRYRLRYIDSLVHITDVCVAGFVGGVIGARLFHVLIHWSYFQDHHSEAWQLSEGGLNWHGAVIGCLLVMLPLARFLKVDIPFILNLLVLPLLIIGFMSWWGCYVAHCSYGAEVDNLSNYPAWLVWEAKGEFNIIAPRYATQQLGMMGVGVVFVLSRMLHNKYRFWITLMMFSQMMLVVDSLRGDAIPEVVDIRLDMWLDMIFAVGSVIVIFATNRWFNAYKGQA